MRGTSILALAALLMTTDARPDGYGVKGGRSYESTANAVASAHAHAGTGSLASASSSASATADSRGYGGSNAIASADASANAGGTEDVGDKENGNANGLIDSDDLRHSNDHGRGTGYKCINPGTASWNQQNPDIGQVTPEFDGEDIERTEQVQGYVGCGSEASKDGAGTPCKDKTFGVDGGSAEGGQSTQTIDASHSSGPCAPGDSKCSTHKLGTSSRYPSHGRTSDSPPGSSSPAGIKGGYGGNTERPGMIDRSHAASPCDPENPKCHVHKPAGSNYYPTPHKHSHSSAGSSGSAGSQEDHATSHGKPETIDDLPAKTCRPGDWKCLTHQPVDSHTQFGGKPDAGSPSPADIDAVSGGYGTELGKPDGASNPSGTCAPGTTCISQKPTVSSPRPTYEGTRDWQHPTGSSGYGEKNIIPGAPGPSTCAPGDSKCLPHKPSVSNPYPTYVENPDPSAGSGPKVIDGGYGGVEGGATSQSDDLGSTPCAPWDSKCSSHKPTVSDLPAFDVENPSYDSQHSEGTVGGYGGHTSTAGSFEGSHSGSPCASGDSKCSAHKPPTIHPVYETKPATWTPTGGHSHPDGVASHYPSSGSKPGTSNPFLNGQIDLSSINRPSSPGKPPAQKINPSNPFLYPHDQAHPQTSQNRPVGAAPQHHQGSFAGGGGFPQDRQKPPNPFLSQPGYAHPVSGVNRPATDGAARHEESEYTIVNGSPNTECGGSVSCSPNKPTTHLSVPPTYPQGTLHQSPRYPEAKPNPLNPFLSHHASGDEPAGSTDLEVGSQDNRYPHVGSQPASVTPGKDCHKSASSSTNEPGGVPSGNPFLTNHRQKIDDHLTSGHGSTQFPDTQSDNGPLASKPVGGHQVTAADGGKPGAVQGCGISSVICNQVPVKMGHQSSMGGGLQSSSTTDRNDHGVKGYRAGIKGGPRQPEHPIRLQGNSALGEDDHVRSEQKPSAENIASASAHSIAHASSSVAGAQSHASAKSEASSNGGHGSSSSWSSSNANASAFASSHSSSGSYHGWTEAGLPEVSAQ